jgi:prepilin-type N-terminal cleavage/methylation domain-containing protein
LGETPIRRRAGSAKRGFTLVEVIVVLVILAILAAIAIPALTGYIDKAQDKQWIAKARNIAMAMRTVISEDYAAGKFGPSGAFAVGYDDDGALDTKLFTDKGISEESVGATENNWAVSFRQRAADLLAAEHPHDDWVHIGFWYIYFFADGDSDVNALGADAFALTLFPDGASNIPSGTQYRNIVVTYKLAHNDSLAAGSATVWNAYYTDRNLHYDADVGYEVYSHTYTQP